jgi:hypothetical protein
MLSRDLEWGGSGNSGLTLSSQQIYIPKPYLTHSFLVLEISFIVVRTRPTSSLLHELSTILRRQTLQQKESVNNTSMFSLESYL